MTATEIKIGNTIPYSGPASSYGAIGRGHTAYFKMVNDRGGVAGRKINFISLDDGVMVPKTVEMTRRLVEQDGVAFTLNQLGTANNIAIQKYLNQKKVPQLFVATGADKWGNYKDNPWTIGWQPSYRTEAQIYAKYILANMPGGRIGVLSQNDDFGKDYLNGLRDQLGDKADKMIVKAVTYEVTDATVDSQIVSLQSSGADVFVNIASPKFAAQAIRKVFDIGWKPLQLMSNVSASVAAVLVPAGPEKGIGIISAGYLKDATDPAWKDDAGLRIWRDFMKQYIPDGDVTDLNYVYAFSVASTMHQVLKQCGEDFSRENIMKQATNLKDFDLPTLLPGIKINTSPTNFHPIRQERLMRWNGKIWEFFGEVLSDA